MAKKMTSAMRLWRDENMEAIREGAKAVKEGRIMPADTFFEWMQARYVRDIWEERIARPQDALEAIYKRATPRSQDFLHPTKEFADDVARMAHAAIKDTPSSV